MDKTIYNIPGTSLGFPGTQGEIMGECCENESRSHDIEKKFVEATTHHVVEALDINYNDRRIVTPLLKKQLDDKLNSRWKQQGLLQQYEAYVLETAGERLRKELGIPEDIPVNHSHATHAKYADWVDYLKAEDKEEFLKKYGKSKKTG